MWGWGTTPILDLWSVKCYLGRGLVRVLASWSSLNTWETRIYPVKTTSLTKWKSVDTCLILEWYTCLVERYVAPILSKFTTRMWLIGTWSSHSKEAIQHTSEVVLATTLYSALVEEHETYFCFLDDQARKWCRPLWKFCYHDVLPNLHQKVHEEKESCGVIVASHKSWFLWSIVTPF